MKKILSVLILMLLVSSCAAFNKLVTNNELTTQLATEAATARVVHEHPSWKKPIISITEDAMGMIDSSKLVQLGDVEAYVKSRIPWLSMMPEEQALVSVLITQVRMNIEDSFRAQAIENPAARMIQVRKVVAWMNDAARRQP